MINNAISLSWRGRMRLVNELKEETLSTLLPHSFVYCRVLFHTSDKSPQDQHSVKCYTSDECDTNK